MNGNKPLPENKISIPNSLASRNHYMDSNTGAAGFMSTSNIQSLVSSGQPFTIIRIPSGKKNLF
jgi:hypothetical protein